MVRCYIISIGDELTKGEIDNSNAGYVARELTRRGYSVSAITALPDSEEEAAPMVEALLENSGVFVFTGGLGATRDDTTRRMLSRVLKKPLVVDEEKVRLLRDVYAEKGREFIETDRMQASFPQGGGLLDNTVGLAYGFTCSAGDRHVFALPGVPKEMESMLTEAAMPRIEQLFPVNPQFRSELLLFADISEYTLDRTVQRILAGHPGVRYGTRAADGLVRLRVESDGADIEACIADCALELGDSFISRDDVRLEAVTGEMLLKAGCTLSVAESCTAGFLSKKITDVPGSSRYFLGGVVSYSNEAKMTILGVASDTLREHGAVSAQTALEMAAGARSRLSSDIALSITGIAGPGGGSGDKPVGTVFIGVDGGQYGHRVEQNRFPGERDGIRKKSVNRALLALYRFLKELNRS